MDLRPPLALVLVGFATVIAAQDAVQQPPPIRTGVEVIHLEVSVLDRERVPVRGLARSDFTVLQDGIAQDIVAFEEVPIADNRTDLPVWADEAAPDIQANAIPQGRLIVLLLDDGMEPGPFAGRTRQIAESIVDRLGPNDRAAVVFTRDNRAAQDFTADRTKLHAAIARFSPGFVFTSPLAERSSRGDYTYFQSSIVTIGEVARSLADIPHRRKLLVYVGIGVPTSVVDASAIPEIGTDVGTSGDLQGLAERAIGALGQALRRARTANLTVYAIDSAGLGGLDAYLGRRPGFVPPPSFMREYMHTVADATGGRAAVEVNDFRPAVERIYAENSSYYVIGYRATIPRDDGKFRRLDVKVNRPGVLVRARSGFETPKPPRKNAVPTSPLVVALAGALPDDGIAMQVTAAAFAASGRVPAVVIVTGLRHPVSKHETTQELQLLTGAFTPEGQPRNSVKMVVRLTLGPSATSDAVYEVLSQIPLKPGRYSLRIAAHNPQIGRTGSVYHDLVVPDFDREALALSGALISATPSVAAAPRDALAKITSIVPTSRRVFSRDDAATVLVRVYQRHAKERRPVTMVATITDAVGSVVFSGQDVMDAERFPADRAADYRFEIPFARLKPGEHLLRVTASAGSDTARRDVRLTVQ